MVVKKACIFIAFGCALVVNAWAGMDEGFAAYKRGDYAAAVQEFAAEASRGNANAQYALSHGNLGR